MIVSGEIPVRVRPVPVCLHCAGGHKAEFQKHSGEWVHRNSRVEAKDEAGRVVRRGFSIVVCVNRPRVAV